MNYSKLTNVNEEVIDTLAGASIDVTGRVNVSPFIEYTFGYNRVNGSVGFGLWHSGSKVDATVSAGFFTVGVETNTRERSIFVPVSIGYDFVQSNAVIGAKARVHFRYLNSVTTEIQLPFFGTVDTTLSGSELDDIEATRLYIAPGLGLYGGYTIGRFTPMLEVGGLYELQGASENSSDENKYLNLYAALTLRFRFLGEKPE